ncbi:MAG: DUF4197 domain-containing protein [Pseudodesulfovibrio sp.]
MNRPLVRVLCVILYLLAALPASGGWTDTLKQAGSELADEKAGDAGLSCTPSEAVSGVREILSTGAGYAAKTLSTGSGFAADSATALSLPDWMAGMTGASALLSAMNGAATRAAAESETPFLDTIKDVSVTNPTSLLSGSSTAVTDYFESRSRDTLKGLVRPIVEQSARAAGVGSAMTALSAAAQATGAAFDPNEYLTEKVLDGMFRYMGIRETELRESGGAGASALLHKLL